jgi:RimJ/RimL family protein N-acetyltransferase
MLKIRPFQWSDVDALHERNVDPETGRTLIILPPKTLESTVEYFAEKINNKDIVLVAEKDGKIAGNLEIRKWKGRSTHVGTIGVALKSEFWGQKIGTELVKEGIKEAKKEGLKKLEYRVMDINKRSINLAKSLKFKLAGRMKKQVKIGKKYIDVLIFEKFL